MNARRALALFFTLIPVGLGAVNVWVSAVAEWWPMRAVYAVFAIGCFAGAVAVWREAAS